MICCYFQHRKRIVTELREGETYCYKWGLLIDAEKQKQTTLWYYQNRPIHQRVLNMGVCHCKIANCLHILIRVEIQTPGSYALSTSRTSKKQYETYPLCQREPETVTHFILRSCGTVIDFIPWWRPQMEKFSALLALCAGNSPVTGEFAAQRPVTRSFDVSFDLHQNKRLSKQSWGWWFETQSRPLWRHRNVQNCVLRMILSIGMFLCV